MRLVLLFLLSTFSLFLFSQDILLNENTEQQVEEEVKGPNTKKFLHFFVASSYFIDQMEGDLAETEYFFSNNIELGVRQKNKINNALSFGYQLSYSRTKFSIKQDDDKLFPDTVQYLKQLVRTHQVKPGVYFRVNFDPKRGNFAGKFFDVGLYGAYYLGRNLFTKTDNQLQNVNSKYTFTRITQYDILEAFEYGIECRLGFNRYMFSAQYRINDIVKISDIEFPRINVGIQIGLHK